MGFVVILRGISGAGKSEYASTLPSSVVCSSDDFHITDLGEYVFKEENKKPSHAYCLNRFTEFVQLPEEKRPPIIIVDNTNIRAVEIAPYYALAEANGWYVEITTVWVDPETAYQRNQHGCGRNLVNEQFQRLVEETDRFPPWWSHRILHGPRDQPNIVSMGADYERLLSMLQLADIPYQVDKNMEWIRVGTPGIDEVTFRFNKNGKMTNEGWHLIDLE